MKWDLNYIKLDWGSDDNARPTTVLSNPNNFVKFCPVIRMSPRKMCLQVWLPFRTVRTNWALELLLFLWMSLDVNLEWGILCKTSATDGAFEWFWRRMMGLLMFLEFFFCREGNLAGRADEVMWSGQNIGLWWILWDTGRRPGCTAHHFIVIDNVLMDVAIGECHLSSC